MLESTKEYAQLGITEQAICLRTAPSSSPLPTLEFVARGGGYVCYRILPPFLS